ncbi:MAG TPA: S8 family peptidase [Syntrophomonadaceae bacterium]|nr:S8 family peptidase [Syntrophomonadaceae bacterium]
MKNSLWRTAASLVCSTLLLAGQLFFPGTLMAAKSMSMMNNLDKELDIQRPQSLLTYQSENLIVKYKNDVKRIDAQSLIGQHQSTSIRKFRSGAELIRLPGSSKSELMSYKQQLEQTGLFEYVEYDYKVYTASAPCNDLLFFKQWALKNTGQFIQLVPGQPGIDINVIPAWTITRGDSNLLVAVTDTGIDLQHPELRNRAWINTGEIPGNGIDDDQNGYVDDVNGYDFYHHDNTVFDAGDQDIHGTHVAGVIAAEANNHQGISGIAPQVKIMALKFMGPDGGNISDAIEAIDYARSKEVKLCNASWSGTEYSQALYDAIEQSGILFIAASGNSGADADSAPEYPAAFTCPNIISVAAINNQGQLASWSNYGANSVDLGAPGVGIMSILELIPRCTFLYGYISGTSQAAPQVTGTAALVFSQFPQMSASEVKNRILNHVKPLPSLEGKTVSGGMVNAYGALTEQ